LWPKKTSIILKLALYGFLRILIPLFPFASLYFLPIVFLIGVITIIWASLVTLRQIDTKRIIAYSSIGHVATSLLGCFSNSIIGLQGSLILGIAHGIVSPSLFILVGGVLYSRYHTRIINYYKGLINYMPIMSSFFLLFSLANSAIPLSINFIGEFLALAGLFSINPILTIFASLSIILSSAYSIYLYLRINTGKVSKYISTSFIIKKSYPINKFYSVEKPYLPKDLFRSEFYTLAPLLFFTFFLGIFPNFILHDIEFSLSYLLI